MNHRPALSTGLALLALVACGGAPTGGKGPGGSGGRDEAGGSGGTGGGSAGRDAGDGRAGMGGGAGGTAGDGGGAGGGGGGQDAGAPPERDAAMPSPRDAAAGPDARAIRDSAGGSDAVPPETWKEHWFEHVQLLKRVDYNDDVAIYFDDAVPRTGTEWITPFMTRLWQYTRETYGSFGPENRLYAIFHQGKYPGGHPSTYFDASHDFRNVSDCGPGPWTGNNIDIPAHETGHVVESANNGVHGSPAFPLWRDSKWMEFYQYDAYVALGLEADAKRVFDRYTATTDNFPRAGTRWFRDWFYPLWRDHGRAQVMAKFFKLLAMHFPKRNGGRDYARDLNWGEYVHFTSGAAGKNLKDLATTAFGWPPEREAEFNAARATFPMITY